MTIKDFSGGINKRIDPVNANPNEALQAVNINLLSTTLQPIQQPQLVIDVPNVNLGNTFNIKTGSLGYKAPQSLVSKLQSYQGTETRILDLGATFLDRELFFICNGYIYPKLLVTAPTKNPISYLDSIIGINATEATTDYAISLYDSVLDIETNLTQIAIARDPAFNKTFTLNISYVGNGGVIPTWATLSNIVVRVYRINGLLTDFHLVKEIPATSYAGTTPNKYGLTTTVYYYTINDTVTDTVALLNNVFDSAKVLNVPYDAQYFTEYVGATFCYSKLPYTNDTQFTNSLAHLNSPSNTLYTTLGTKATILFRNKFFINFTDVGTANFYVTNFFNSLEEITGFGKCASGLLIFTENTTRLLVGSDKTTYVLNNISDTLGCTSHFSIANYHGTCIWTDGIFIYGSTGYQITNMSIGKIQDGNTVLNFVPRDISNIVLTGYSSIVIGDSYYLAVVKSEYAKVILDGVEIPSQVQSVDILVRFNLTANTFSVIDSSIYINQPNLSTSWNIVSNNSCLASSGSRLAFINLANATYKVLDYLDITKPLESITWESQKISEGSATLPKTYNSISLAMRGEAKLVVRIDDHEVLNTIVTTRGLEDFQVIRMKIPQEYKTGYTIQFVITGVCIVHELKYEVVPSASN